LVIFEGNDFKDKVLWGHWEKQDNQIAIVLVPGRYKPRILKKLPSSLVAKFESPKPWERDPWVVSFLQKEAEGLGFQISTQLSSLLVKRLGSEDLYLLWQQLWKLKFLLSHEGRSHVQIEDLKATLTKQSSVGAFYLIKKIGYKSKQEVPILLRLIKENGGILFSFLALLMKNLRTWIVVKSLSNKSTSPEEISKRLGISSFLLKKEILTITTRWSLEELSDFMKRVLEVRSAAKKGSLAPWLHLESILLEL
jgi:DNA polymerase III delta subunit